MFSAIYMPGDGGENDPTKHGFKSIMAAAKYIETRICDDCKKDLYSGFVIYVLSDGSKELHPIRHVLSTDCGGEWFIEPQDKNKLDK